MSVYLKSLTFFCRPYQ